jgi:hypothetical protein
MPSKNPEILKKHRDTWYRNNKPLQLKRQKERRIELAEWFVGYKRDLFCRDCGMNFDKHPECCDFHHIDLTNKKGTVYSLLRSSKKAVLEEISKCVSLCANCHRIRHKDLYTWG